MRNHRPARLTLKPSRKALKRLHVHSGTRPRITVSATHARASLTLRVTA
jgi:hypothetical protein